jgi:2-phosphoglycolate phosphatase
VTDHRAGTTSVAGVLFDLDGTLVDSLPAIGAAMSRTLREFGYEIEPDAIIPLIGAPMQVLAQQLTGVTDEVAARMYQRYLERYFDEFIQLTSALEGADALLERLSAAGLALAVVTNKNEYGGKRTIAIQGWDRYFDSVVGRDTAAHPKPAPDGPLYALNALAVEVCESAFVGDTEFDMEAARSAGIPLRIALLGARSVAQLEAAGATHIIEALDEVEAIVLERRPAQPPAVGG